MEYAETIVQRKGHIGIISINRPKQMNSLTMRTMDEIIAALKEFDADDDVYVVILKGEGRAFSTGHSLPDLRTSDKKQAAKVFAKPAEVLQAIQGIKKPVIAMIHAYALAVGTAIAIGCDLVVAAEKTKLQLPGASFGTCCGTPTLGIFRSTPRKKVLEMNFTTEMLDVSEAERFGMVNKVVPLEKLEEETMKLAEKIASNAPIAVQSAKMVYYQLAGMDYVQTGNLIGKIMADNNDTEDARQAVEALIEKRPHNPFIGR